MKCVICRHEQTEPGLVTVTLHRDETVAPPKSPNSGDFELRLPQNWGLGGKF
jgi:hypothetical protein